MEKSVVDKSPLILEYAGDSSVPIIIKKQKIMPMSSKIYSLPLGLIDDSSMPFSS